MKPQVPYSSMDAEWGLPLKLISRLDEEGLSADELWGSQKIRIYTYAAATPIRTSRQRGVVSYTLTIEDVRLSPGDFHRFSHLKEQRKLFVKG